MIGLTGGEMGWKERERWCCTNPDCRSEVVVLKSAAALAGENPRCCCGSVMKRPYERPERKRLDDAEKIRKLVELLRRPKE